jgi:hypothetical protein
LYAESKLLLNKFVVGQLTFPEEVVDVPGDNLLKGTKLTPKVDGNGVGRMIGVEINLPMLIFL